MKSPVLFRNLLLAFLAAIFSISLMFAFTELPRLFGTVLGEFPGMDHGGSEINAFKTEIYISSLHLRWIGYSSLGLVLVFIILGFVTKKSGWGLLGAFALFLPVFGNFALSMFFLAGLGVLRVGWLPFLDISFQMLDLGNVILLPYWILEWIFFQFNYWVQAELGWFFMGLGAFLFCWGVLVWMQARFNNRGVASSWIYRISRHPQYLGWIIWSYGLAIYTPLINDQKKSWGIASSLPLLLMIMIIIGMCMLEEIKMREKYGNEYDKYRNRTPFMFPLPGWLRKIIKFPMWLLIRKRYPERKREVALIISVYTFILIGISLFWVDTGIGKVFPVTEAKRRVEVERLVDDLHHPMHWRVREQKFIELNKYGNSATPYIIGLLSDSIPENQECAAKLVGHTGDTRAIQPLMKLLTHPWEDIRISAIYALVQLQSPGIEQILKEQLVYEGDRHPRNAIYESLISINAQNSWDVIQQGANYDDPWGSIGAVKAMARLYPDSTAPYLIPLLECEHNWIRSEAVAIAIIISDQRTIPYLEELLKDDIYEIRFFSREALNEIREE